MISIIHVTLTRGEFTTPDHLRSWIQDVYSFESPLHLQDRAARGRDYCAELASPSVFACTPLPCSHAFFLYLNDREFEVVIETFYQGNLLRSSESVVQALNRRLAQGEMEAKTDLSLQYPEDAQTYMSGVPGQLVSRVWRRLRSSVGALLASALLILIAGLWLPTYVPEAIAVLIGATFITVWQLFGILSQTRGEVVDWRIHGQ